MKPVTIIAVVVVFLFVPSSVFAQINEGSFEFPNGSFVSYYFENGDVTEMLIDEDAKSIIVKVISYAEGTFAISIPRELLDAKYGSQDADFFVLVGGEQIEFTEERNQDFRSIGFETLSTDREFEIIGTTVYSGSSNTSPYEETINRGYTETNSLTVYYYAYPLLDWADYAEGALEAAFKQWEDTNPDLEFIPVQSETQADLLLGWVKDFGGLHVGYNLGNYIEIGLGDSECGTWQGYHSATVQYIAAHELGHYLGNEHSSNPNDLMYPDIQLIQYYDEPWEFVSAPGYVSFIPLCSSLDVTAYQYQISIDDPNGFDVYFVPSEREYEKSLSTTFDYYEDRECWGENVREFSGTCSGVSGQGGLIISLPDTGGRDLITITANLQETTLSGSSSTSSTFSESYPSETFESFGGTSSVFTDKSQYGFGDTVSISGTISETGQRHRVQVTVTDPLGQIVAKTRVVTTSAGAFQTFTTIPNFNPSGTYTISVYNEQGLFLGDAKFSVGSSQSSDSYFDYVPKSKNVDKFKKFQTSNFVIQYSTNWDVDDEIIDMGAIPDISSSTTSFVGFYDKPDGWDSLFDIRLYEDEQGSMKYSGNSYLNYLVGVLRDDCKILSFEVEGYVCSNHSITNSEIIEINGKQAYKVTETWTETYPNQDSYRNVRIIVDIPVGNDVWSLDSTTTSSEYPKYAAVINKMINSFKIIEAGTVLQTDNISPLVMIPSDIVAESDSEFGAFVEYSVKAIDDTDGILMPFCSPSSSSFFPIGKTEVKCLATDLSGNYDEKSFFVTVQGGNSVKIPTWVKNVAEFWCNDEIEDGSFVESIQYLIDNNVIIVNVTSSGSGISEEIPSWIKNNACWWSEGLISDGDFASGIEYLVREGIIRV